MRMQMQLQNQQQLDFQRMRLEQEQLQMQQQMQMQQRMQMQQQSGSSRDFGIREMQNVRQVRPSDVGPMVPLVPHPLGPPGNARSAPPMGGLSPRSPVVVEVQQITQ